MKIKDWSGFLIIATILITVVRYSAAFAASDVGEITGGWSEVVTFGLALTGLGMGILDVLGGGLLFNGWRKVMPRAGDRWNMKFKILTTCVISLVVSGLIILIPFTVSRMTHQSITEALGGNKSFFLWLWAAMVNVIPYVLIAGVFTGNRMVEDLEVSEKVSTPTGNKEESFEKVSETWRKMKSKLSLEDMKNLANLSPENMKSYASETGFTYKTISNWRANARKELGLGENHE